MARLARIVIPGCPHHVTHRGNRGEPVFYEASERTTYLGWLSEYAARYGMQVWAYCLMTNHIHLVAVPDYPNSLEKAVGCAHRRYAWWLNRRRGWRGHLWANRFYSTPMDTAHCWAAVRYVELNPVRAALVEDALDYRWSSARAHSGLVIDSLLSPHRPFPGPISDWPAWLDVGSETPEWQNLRQSTSTGRPCGSDEFVRNVEARIGRPVRQRRRGRRRKS